jgi:carboxylesterase type B
MVKTSSKRAFGHAVILLALAVHRVFSGPTAKVINGTYEGYHLPLYGQDVFLGLPYAQAPMGDLRFRAPESLNSAWDGIRYATQYKDVCMQYTVSASQV